MDATPVSRLRLAAVTAGTICIVLALVPARTGAAGKRVSYSGPVDLAELEPGVVPHASIEFTVRFKSRHGTRKLVPKSITVLKERNLYETCDPPFTSSSGTYAHVYPSSGNSDNNFVMVFEGNINVGKRRFSSSYTDNNGDGSSSSFSVTGKIPRRGPATGTIRMRDYFPAQTGSQPDPPHDCDTGILNWTASKQ